MCKSAAARGDLGNLCAQCAADPTRICVNVESVTTRCCGVGQECCGLTACCSAGQNCCPAQNRCVTCAEGETFNPVTCECETEGGPNQPCETFFCGAGLCAGTFEDPVENRCACFEEVATPGQGRCLSDFFCFVLPECQSSADCPADFSCVTNTCCGQGVRQCAPRCNVEQSQGVSLLSVVGGRTASGG